MKNPENVALKNSIQPRESRGYEVFRKLKGLQRMGRKQTKSPEFFQIIEPNDVSRLGSLMI